MDLRKYGVETSFYLPLIMYGETDFKFSPTLAAVDTKVAKDGGTLTQTTNTATVISNTLVKITLTATEMECSLGSIQFIDAATKQWEDTQVNFSTFGHASALITGDFNNLDEAVSVVDTVVDGIKAVTDNLPDSGALTTLQADTDDIQSRLPASLVSGRMSSDAEAISGDSAAADNLELQYDGTGLTGDTFPATQSQLDNIALTGAAVSTPAKDSPNGFTIGFGENEANDEDSTHALDGITHDIEAQDDSGIERINAYYEFSIGGDGVPTGVHITHQLDKGGGAAKNITVQAFRWPSTWDTIGTLQSGTSLSTGSFTLFTSHVGTGADLGLVRIRYLTGSVAFTATTKLLVDQIFVEYAIVSRTVGYAGGAIWVDTGASNTNTESFVDGTADNPVSTWAAALTLSSQLNIDRFHIANGSSITLTANSDNYTVVGQAYSVVLGGQSINGAFFFGANISGTGTSSGTHPVFEDCPIGATTLPPSIMRRCFWSSTITAGAAGDWFLNNCTSRTAGTADPIFDFGAVIGTTNLNVRGYFGGIDIRNMGQVATDEAHIEGVGHVTLNANCVGGTMEISGAMTKNDSSSGMTINDDARIDVDQVNAAADVALADYAGPTNTEMEARTRPTADYFDQSTDKVALGNEAHGGAAATLTLEDVTVVSASGEAVTVVGEGGGSGIKATGGDSGGTGIQALGGDQGDGLVCKGGASGGIGANVVSQTGSTGLRIAAAVDQPGIAVATSGTGKDIYGSNLLARFADGLSTVLKATVQASPSPTQTQCDTDLTLVNADQLKNRIMLFLDGNVVKAQAKITASTTGGLLTYEAVPVAPADGDTLIIV